MKNDLNSSKIIEGKPIYKVLEIKTLKELLRISGERYKDQIAFRYRDNPQAETQSKTYHEFVNDVDSLGSALLKMGLSGSKIAIIGENRYEWVISYLAVCNGVGVAVPLDRALPINEIEVLLRRGEIDVLIYSDAFTSIVEKLSASYGFKKIICMNPKDEGLKDNQNYCSIPELLNMGHKLIKTGYKDYIDSAINPDEMRILLFTSGTSSSSKAVMLSHQNICSNIVSLGGIIRFEHGESVLSILPLHHTFENTAGLLFPLYLGMTISICDGLKYLSKNLIEYRPDCIVGVPLIYDKFKNRIVDELNKKRMLGKVKALMGACSIIKSVYPNLPRKIFKKLLEPFGGKLKAIVTGGAPMDAQTARFYEGIGVKVFQGYGLTETSPVVAGCNDRIRKPGSCGQPLPGVKIAISNPDSNGNGEILVKGKNVMLGYWKDEEATREAIVDGWFHTGDLGCINKHGLIYVTGRAKSMIVLKNGKKVFPEELESYLNKLSYVKESLVWGEPSPDGTIEICSKIILDKEYIAKLVESTDNENGIRRLLDSAIKEINKLIPTYKKIKYYVFGYEELVKTTSMKIKRYVETAQIREALNKMATSIKKAAGENIDKLMEMMSRGVENF